MAIAMYIAYKQYDIVHGSRTFLNIKFNIEFVLLILLYVAYLKKFTSKRSWWLRTIMKGCLLYCKESMTYYILRLTYTVIDVGNVFKGK